jgi:hypothetical protein
MKATEQTLQQIERAIRKTADKFPADPDTSVMTDIHVRVIQDSGELITFDDNEEEITRGIVEQWIDNTDDDFYTAIPPIIRKCIERQKTLVDNMGIMKPFTFVLENDEKEPVEELYIVDDDLVIIDSDMMQGLDKDLDDFLDNLLKDA